ncbi:MAG: hypothetical protein AAFY38_09890 [Pseudomonadota bacterium]
MIIPALLGALSLALGLFLGLRWVRARRWGRFGLIFVLGAVVFAWAVIAVQGRENRSGFDGVAEIALAFLFAAPLSLGALIGGAIALWQARG